MTFQDFQTNIYDDLSVSTSDTFYSLAYIKRRINANMKRVAGYFNWPQTEDAVNRDSEAGQEWYNYPENMKQDSIKKLMYNGEYYDKINYPDYLRYKKDFGANATDKVFTDFQNKYFINPTPATAIPAGISLWGQVIPADMSANSDVTPFYNDPDIEQIIYDFTLADCYKKGRGTMYERGRNLEIETLQKLNIIRQQVLLRQASYKTKNNSMFKNTRLIKRRSATRRARFTISDI